MKNQVASRAATLKIIFFGNERLATGVTTSTPVLRSLHKSGYQVELVVANTHQVTSRRDRPLEILETAKKLGLKAITPARLADAIDELERIQPDLGVVVAYGQIIPSEIIELFPLGMINLHPSLLPQYRGSTPIETALLDGRQQTGVSIMQVTAALDSGPIYAQESINISPTTSKQALADQLSLEGSKILADSIKQIAAGAATPKPQRDSDASYTKRIGKSDGKLDGSKTSAELARELRAYAGWPGIHLDYLGKQITIISARATTIKTTPSKLTNISGKLYFGCRDGSIEIDRLQPAGKQTMSAKDFINGHPELRPNLK